jgi:glycosyltransferase involved in cell wall biosynthesis
MRYSVNVRDKVYNFNLRHNKILYDYCSSYGGDTVKKVLIFSPIFYPDIGGPAIQGRYLAELLSKNGYEVVILKYGATGNVNLGVNIRIRSLSWKGQSKIGRILKWIISPAYALFFVIREKPSLYIANSVFMPGMIFGLVFRLFGIPTIIKFAGDWVSENLEFNKNNPISYRDVYKFSMISMLLFNIEKFFLKKFTKIWVISDFRARNVIDIVGNANTIWIQRNFHDLPSINEQKIMSKCLVLFSANRLVKHKRIDQILESLAQIKNQNFIYIVCGSGPEMKSLQIYSKKLDLQKKVFFLGEVGGDLLKTIMGLADVYVSWSAEEGAPNVFIEAMNSGLAIVTANVGGIPEMFENAHSALLLNPNSLADLESAILNLINNRAQLEFLQESSRNEVFKYRLEYNESYVLNMFDTLVV